MNNAIILLVDLRYRIGNLITDIIDNPKLDDNVLSELANAGLALKDISNEIFELRRDPN